MTSDLILRDARPADAEAIAAIYAPYVRETTVSFEEEPVSAEAMARRLAVFARHWPVLVAERGGRVVGYCYAHPWKERAAYALTLETTIYLEPSACGGGIGPMLMRRLADECRLRGAHALVACITDDNAASIAMHRRLGFREVSHFTEVGRKFGRWLGVVDMEMIL